MIQSAPFTATLPQRSRWRRRQRTACPEERNKILSSSFSVVTMTLLLVWIVLFLSLMEETTLRQLSDTSSDPPAGATNTISRRVTSTHPTSLSLSTETSNNNRQERWFWIGMVRDANEVQDSTWDTLVYAACTHGIHIHVVVAKNVEHARRELFSTTRQKETTLLDEEHHPQPPGVTKQVTCAPIYVETEQDLGISQPLPSNRVQKIATLRDAQRKRIRKLYMADRPSFWVASPDDIVIVADLDLFRLPSVTMVLEQANKIATNTVDLDVVCAAGVTMASRNELWYYDTYATVFLPDTFVHPLKRRLIKEYYPGEDPNLVRSDNQHGSFTQGDIMRYLGKQAVKTGGTVRVRSCFGGLSIYRAPVWLETSCQYTLEEDAAGRRHLLDRYASANDGMPCEHVTFHTCLQDTAGKPANIAINPSLLTLWKKN